MRTIQALRDWLQEHPEGSTFSVAAVIELLARVDEPPSGPALVRDDAPDFTWQERLWIVPAETRIGVSELAEAMGKPKSWVYRHTSKRSTDRGYSALPFRRLEAELLFVVGEIRAWIRDNEDIEYAGRMSSEESERREWKMAS